MNKMWCIICITGFADSKTVNNIHHNIWHFVIKKTDLGVYCLNFDTLLKAWYDVLFKDTKCFIQVFHHFDSCWNIHHLNELNAIARLDQSPHEKSLITTQNDRQSSHVRYKHNRFLFQKYPSDGLIYNSLHYNYLNCVCKHETHY